jgi:hypothetical protein
VCTGGGGVREGECVNGCACARVCECVGGCGCTGAVVFLRACSLTNSACGHIAICGFSGSTIYLILSHQEHDFRKTFIEYKECLLIFSTTIIRNRSHFKKKLLRFWHKCENVFMYSTCYSCWILINLEFPRQIFEKNSNIKFHQNPSSRSQVVPCGRTDRQTWWSTGMTKLIVPSRNFANVPENEEQ